MIRMLWFRVDNRLVHGQVIEGWLPYVAARHLIVANDAMSADLLQQQIVSLAVPEQVAIHFVPVDALLETLACCGESSLVLFADCQDARRALESVRAASEGLALGITPDAVLTDVEGAMAALGELTGRSVREDVVERIFARFCVGK